MRVEDEVELRQREVAPRVKDDAVADLQKEIRNQSAQLRPVRWLPFHVYTLSLFEDVSRCKSLRSPSLSLRGISTALERERESTVENSTFSLNDSPLMSWSFMLLRERGTRQSNRLSPPIPWNRTPGEEPATPATEGDILNEPNLISSLVSLGGESNGLQNC